MEAKTETRTLGKSDNAEKRPFNSQMAAIKYAIELVNQMTGLPEDIRQEVLENLYRDKKRTEEENSTGRKDASHV